MLSLERKTWSELFLSEVSTQLELAHLACHGTSPSDWRTFSPAKFVLLQPVQLPLEVRKGEAACRDGTMTGGPPKVKIYQASTQGV
jgi:hypothetical protein